VQLLADVAGVADLEDGRRRVERHRSVLAHTTRTAVGRTTIAPSRRGGFSQVREGWFFSNWNHIGTTGRARWRQGSRLEAGVVAPPLFVFRSSASSVVPVAAPPAAFSPAGC
jgi:hypothetical protein